MHLFGDPNFPKRNLTGGAVLLALSSVQFGTTVERLIWSNGPRVDYFFLVAWVGLLFAAIKIFRLALASVPSDPKDQRTNQRRLE
jgi:hypothetical protein